MNRELSPYERLGLAVGTTLMLVAGCNLKSAFVETTVPLEKYDVEVKIEYLKSENKQTIEGIKEIAFNNYDANDTVTIDSLIERRNSNYAKIDSLTTVKNSIKKERSFRLNNNWTDYIVRTIGFGLIGYTFFQKFLPPIFHDRKRRKEWEREQKEVKE